MYYASCSIRNSSPSAEHSRGMRATTVETKGGWLFRILAYLGPVAHSEFYLGGCRVEGINIVLMQIQ